MSIVARHEIVKELAGTALVQVWRIKTPSKPDGSLVLKRCRLLQDGFSDRRSAVTSFLDSARVQQSAGSAPPSRWAPVHELVEDADGGQYVTDFYPSSAQRLVNGKVRLTAAALYAVVKAILTGLVELRKNADRSHGNLKASNVLIAGSDEIAFADVFLSDPADSANPAAHDGGADDLFQLGQLIHLLVLHQSFRPVVGWPIEPSPAWSKFGYAGRRWRDFCNHLLDPNALARPGTLEAALAELERVRRRPVWHLAVGAAVAAVLVAAVGAGLVTHRRHTHIRQDAQALRSEYQGWFRSFATLVGDLPPEVVRGDQYIAGKVVAPIKAALEAEATGGRNLLHAKRVEDLYTNPPSAFDDTRSGELREVLGLVRRTEAALSKWEVAAWLDQRRQTYAERRWEELAEYFKQLAEGVKPSSEKAGTQMEHVLRHHADLKKYTTAIDETWAAMDKQLQGIKANAAGAVAPLWFDQYVRAAPKSYRIEVDSPADLEAFLSRLTELRRQCDEFAGFVPPGWAEGVALARVLDEEAEDAKQERAVADWPYFRAWGRKLEQYKLQPVPADVVDALARALNESETPLQQLRVLKAPPETVSAFDGRIAELKKQVEQLRSQPLARQDADDRRRQLDGLIRQYGSDVADVLRRLRPAQAADVWYSAATKQLKGIEPPVERVWLRLLAQLVPKPVARLDEDRNAQQYVQLREQVAQWASALRAVPPHFPAAEVGEPFDAVIAARRLAAIEDAANRAVAAGRPDAGDAPFAEVRKQYDAWLNGVRELAGHWQAARELLESGGDLEAKGRTGLSLAELEDVIRQALAQGNFPEAVTKQITTELASVGRMREDYEAASALRRDADAFKVQGNLPGALRLYVDVAKLRPGDAEVQAQVKGLQAAVEQRAAALTAQAEAEFAAQNLDAAEDTLKKLADWSPGPASERLNERLKAARADARRQEVEPVLVNARALLREKYDPDGAIAALAQSNHPDAAAFRKSVQELIDSAEANARTGDQYLAQRDYTRASDYYVAAARGGSDRALYRLGVMARDGLGAPADETGALAWFKLAAARGSAEASRAAIDMQSSRQAAMQLGQLRKSAEDGNVEAQLSLAEMYDGQQNWTLATRFYLKAAEQQDPVAMYRLAQKYEKGGQGLPKNTRQARELYGRAARAGHGGAQAWVKQNRRTVDRSLIDNTRQ